MEIVPGLRFTKVCLAFFLLLSLLKSFIHRQYLRQTTDSELGSDLRVPTMQLDSEGN